MKLFWKRKYTSTNVQMQNRIICFGKKPSLIKSLCKWNMWHGLCIIIYFGFNAFVAFENCNASLHNLFNKVLLRFNQLYLRLKYIKLNYLAFLSLKWPFIEQHHNHIDLKLIPSTSININFLEINSWKKNNSPNSRIFN